MEVAFQLTVSDPSQVRRVDLYYRLVDKSSGETSAWNNASMSGLKVFTYTLQAINIPGVTSHDTAWVEYEYVAVAEGEVVIARSQRYRDLDVSACHSNSG